MKVAVLMGGPSHEREISMKSGTQVSEALQAAGHEVTEVVIARDGAWHMGDDILSPEQAAAIMKSRGMDVIFPALHGPYGEDGRIQGFLDIVGLPYVGSSLLGAAISMDKEITKALYAAHGIPVAKHTLITDAADLEIDDFPPKAVIKAVAQGSSFGLEIVNNINELKTKTIEFLREFGPPVIVEEFIKGREITCGVLWDPDEGRLIALPLTEIIPRVADYFDFRAKYEPGGSEEITPAPISPDTTALIQNLALRAHRALRLGSMSRTDFILGPDGPVALETNSIPGFTRASLLPQEAAAQGIGFPALVDKLVRAAVLSDLR